MVVCKVIICVVIIYALEQQIHIVLLSYISVVKISAVKQNRANRSYRLFI